MDAETPTPKSLTDRTVLAAQAILSGKSRGPGAYLAFAGPAVVASIAYMDPGNFATNIQAGAKYGYTLLWVVLLANLIAMLFQALSAKLGIVTGRNLAEMCRDNFSKPVVMAMWVDQRDRRHGHRSRRISRRRGRPGAAVQDAADLRHGRHRRHHLRHPHGGEPRLPAGGADHRQLGRHHRALLLDRDVHRAGRLGRGGLSFGRSGTARRRGADDFGRHHRRHRHAARGLFAFRPHAGAHAGPRRARAAPAGAHLQP